MKTYFLSKVVFLTVLAGVCCLLPKRGHAQAISIVATGSHQTFQLPDTTAIKSAADAQSAILTAEAAGKALMLDLAAVNETATAEEGNMARAETLKNNYFNAVNAFSKNDVEPYKADLSNYDAQGAKFTDRLNKYKKAVLANNALPAKDRKPATVAALNKEKIHIDSMATDLSRRKTTLDAAKAKLDVKNAALQKQQQNYQALEQSAMIKLKSLKISLSRLSDQLSTCERYDNRYRELLQKKFNVANPGDGSYFATPAYKTAFHGITTLLLRLNSIQ